VDDFCEDIVNSFWKDDDGGDGDGDGDGDDGGDDDDGDDDDDDDDDEWAECFFLLDIFFLLLLKTFCAIPGARESDIFEPAGYLSTLLN